jgi:hypothetical protein
LSSEILLQASVMIDRPILDVFNFVRDIKAHEQWIPFYSNICFHDEPDDAPDTTPGTVRFLKKGEYFKATVVPLRFLDPIARLGIPLVPGSRIKVYLDDVVEGRRLLYRSSDVSWSTLCDFESSAGRTILTTSHSLWSWPAMGVGYWLGPLVPWANDWLRGFLNGLKLRLEGRRVEGSPRIFFSYRRAKAKYAGGRIYDALAHEFGEGTVFRDTDSLLAGTNWFEGIEAALARSQVVVAHIGDGWEEALRERWEARKGAKDASQWDTLLHELNTALTPRATESGPGGKQPVVIAVLTSAKEHVTAGERMHELREKLDFLREERAYDLLNQRHQSLLLRSDPDFTRDLDLLIRSVWRVFRE